MNHCMQENDVLICLHFFDALNIRRDWNSQLLARTDRNEAHGQSSHLRRRLDHRTDQIQRRFQNPRAVKQRPTPQPANYKTVENSV